MTVTGSPTVDGKEKRFALIVNFRDGSSGVYLATIPAKSYRRMGSPAASAPVAGR